MVCQHEAPAPPAPFSAANHHLPHGASRSRRPNHQRLRYRAALIGLGAEVTGNFRLSAAISFRSICRVMFFTDEVGHEEFADSNYPIFGMDGIAVLTAAMVGHARAAQFMRKQRPRHRC